GGNNDVRREHGQFSHILAHPFRVARVPAEINAHIATVGPAQLLQSLQECCDGGLSVRILGLRTRQHEDASWPFRLRQHCRRPSRRTTEKRDERTPSHCRAPEARDRTSYRLRLARWRVCPLWVISGHFAS